MERADLRFDVQRQDGRVAAPCAPDLDQDFRREPFGPIPLRMALAERVDKLHAICVQCGSPATRTQRLIDGKPARYDEPVILVGGMSCYFASKDT